MVRVLEMRRARKSSRVRRKRNSEGIEFEGDGGGGWSFGIPLRNLPSCGYTFEETASLDYKSSAPNGFASPCGKAHGLVE